MRASVRATVRTCTHRVVWRAGCAHEEKGPQPPPSPPASSASPHRAPQAPQVPQVRVRALPLRFQADRSRRRSATSAEMCRVRNARGACRRASATPTRERCFLSHSLTHFPHMSHPILPIYHRFLFCTRCSSTAHALAECATGGLYSERPSTAMTCTRQQSSPPSLPPIVPPIVPHAPMARIQNSHVWIPIASLFLFLSSRRRHASTGLVRANARGTRPSCVSSALRHATRASRSAWHATVRRARRPLSRAAASTRPSRASYGSFRSTTQRSSADPAPPQAVRPVGRARGGLSRLGCSRLRSL